MYMKTAVVMAMLSVGVAALGVFALPSMVSMFLEGFQMPAETPSPTAMPTTAPPQPFQKMPEEINISEEEMMTKILAIGPHHNFPCRFCHYSPFSNFTFRVECMDCHGAGNISGHWTYPLYQNNCTICHYNYDIGNYTDFISAGGFGLNATPEDIGNMASHLEFVLAAMNSSDMEGANEACIACHTPENVSITWIKPEYMSFDVGFSDEEGEKAEYKVGNFTPSGKITTEVNSSEKK
ncbi:MAG: hypothetical protein J7L30_01875 [Methanophagales archaeon]|nr:hypothetical protein [Methanophagales archaeon]